ncbi:MAG: ArsR family transcriptional regulator [Planctomycetota bacterium]|nr:MAG: ArsR family transcriptional regulator [Planctomycetota bacterium]
MTTQTRMPGSARLRDRVAALAELGIDDPLKLDIMARLMAEPGATLQVGELAARMGKSLGAVRHAVAELAQRGLIEHVRFYNRESCRFAAPDNLALRLADLLQRSPAERRAMRFALLSRRR